MAAERRAEATWRGDLTSGAGTVDRVGSGAFGPLDVTWASRTEEPNGKTSPEELIAAAHAACFSMAFANILAKAGNSPEQLNTSATVTFVPGTGITSSALEVDAVVPGIDDAAFQEAAEEARDGCPVSGALKNNVELSVKARLASGVR
jgi:osmotically inducible protein OsmC